MVEAEVEERLVRIERQLAELRRRVEVVERSLAVRADNPSDRTAVREKVTFDWQG